MSIGRLARAAAVVAIFGLVSRLLGFAREIVLLAAYGTTGVTDAFVNSLLIVNSVAAVLLYTLVTLIIPTFQQEKADAGDASAWRLVGALALWVGAGLVVVSSAVAVWPEAPASIFGLDPVREAATADLIRIMAPALALQGFSAIFTAMLQIHGRFAGPAAVGVAFNFGVISGVVAGQGSLGIEAAAWGVALGATLQVLLQLPQFVRLLRVAHARPALSHPRLGAVGLLALPVLGASVLQQINNFTDKFFASTLKEGGVAALSAANALGQAPRVALLLPLLTPLFPVISRLVADHREPEAISAFRRVSGLLAVLSIPMMAVLCLYADEVAQLAFQRGECGPGCTSRIGPPLQYYALGLWPAFASMLLNRTLSAARRQKAILWTTIVTVVVTIVLDLILLGPMEQAGLALAATLGVYVNATILLLCLRRHFPSLETRRLLVRQLRVLVAAGVAAGVALALDRVLPTEGMGTVSLIAPLTGKVLAFLVVFGALARILSRTELSEGIRSVRALTGRGGAR